MDPRFDELIESAAPPVAPRSPDLHHALRSLISDTEAAALPPRPRLGRRIGVASLAVASVIGIGATAAAAAGLVPTPSFLPWSDKTLSSGTMCEVQYGVAPQPEPARLRGISPADQAASLEAAKKFMRAFDMSSISVKDVVARATAADDKYRSSGEFLDLPADERPPKDSADEIEIGAVAKELYARISVELTHEGLNPEAVSMTTGSRCADGSDE